MTQVESVAPPITEDDTGIASELRHEMHSANTKRGRPSSAPSMNSLNSQTAPAAIPTKSTTAASKAVAATPVKSSSPKGAPSLPPTGLAKHYNTRQRPSSTNSSSSSANFLSASNGEAITSDQIGLPETLPQVATPHISTNGSWVGKGRSTETPPRAHSTSGSRRPPSRRSSPSAVGRSCTPNPHSDSRAGGSGPKDVSTATSQNSGVEVSPASGEWTYQRIQHRIHQARTQADAQHFTQALEVLVSVQMSLDSNYSEEAEDNCLSADQHVLFVEEVGKEIQHITALWMEKLQKVEAEAIEAKRVTRKHHPSLGNSRGNVTSSSSFAPRKIHKVEARDSVPAIPPIPAHEEEVQPGRAETPESGRESSRKRTPRGQPIRRDKLLMNSPSADSSLVGELSTHWDDTELGPNKHDPFSNKRRIMVDGDELSDGSMHSKHPFHHTSTEESITSNPLSPNHRLRTRPPKGLSSKESLQTSASDFISRPAHEPATEAQNAAGDVEEPEDEELIREQLQNDMARIENEAKQHRQPSGSEFGPSAKSGSPRPLGRPPSAPKEQLSTRGSQIEYLYVAPAEEERTEDPSDPEVDSEMIPRSYIRPPDDAMTSDPGCSMRGTPHVSQERSRTVPGGERTSAPRTDGGAPEITSDAKEDSRPLGTEGHTSEKEQHHGALCESLSEGLMPEELGSPKEDEWTAEGGLDRTQDSELPVAITSAEGGPHTMGVEAHSEAPADASSPVNHPDTCAQDDSVGVDVDNSAQQADSKTEIHHSAVSKDDSHGSGAPKQHSHASAVSQDDSKAAIDKAESGEQHPLGVEAHSEAPADMMTVEEEKRDKEDSTVIVDAENSVHLPAESKTDVHHGSLPKEESTIVVEADKSVHLPAESKTDIHHGTVPKEESTIVVDADNSVHLPAESQTEIHHSAASKDDSHDGSHKGKEHSHASAVSQDDSKAAIDKAESGEQHPLGVEAHSEAPADMMTGDAQKSNQENSTVIVDADNSVHLPAESKTDVHHGSLPKEESTIVVEADKSVHLPAESQTDIHHSAVSKDDSHGSGAPKQHSHASAASQDDSKVAIDKAESGEQHPLGVEAHSEAPAEMMTVEEEKRDKEDSTVIVDAENSVHLPAESKTDVHHGSLPKEESTIVVEADKSVHLPAESKTDIHHGTVPKEESTIVVDADNSVHLPAESQTEIHHSSASKDDSHDGSHKGKEQSHASAVSQDDSKAAIDKAESGEQHPLGVEAHSEAPAEVVGNGQNQPGTNSVKTDSVAIDEDNSVNLPADSKTDTNHVSRLQDEGEGPSHTEEGGDKEDDEGEMEDGPCSTIPHDASHLDSRFTDEPAIVAVCTSSEEGDAPDTARTRTEGTPERVPGTAADAEDVSDAETANPAEAHGVHPVGGHGAVLSEDETTTERRGVSQDGGASWMADEVAAEGMEPVPADSVTAEGQPEDVDAEAALLQEVPHSPEEVHGREGPVSSSSSSAVRGHDDTVEGGHSGSVAHSTPEEMAADTTGLVKATPAAPAVQNNAHPTHERQAPSREERSDSEADAAGRETKSTAESLIDVRIQVIPGTPANTSSRAASTVASEYPVPATSTPAAATAPAEVASRKMSASHASSTGPKDATSPQSSKPPLGTSKKPAPAAGSAKAAPVKAADKTAAKKTSTPKSSTTPSLENSGSSQPISSQPPATPKAQATSTVDSNAAPSDSESAAKASKASSTPTSGKKTKPVEAPKAFSPAAGAPPSGEASATESPQRSAPVPKKPATPKPTSFKSVPAKTSPSEAKASEGKADAVTPVETKADKAATKPTAKPTKTDTATPDSDTLSTGEISNQDAAQQPSTVTTTTPGVQHLLSKEADDSMKPMPQRDFILSSTVINQWEQETNALRGNDPYFRFQSPSTCTAVEYRGGYAANKLGRSSKGPNSDTFQHVPAGSFCPPVERASQRPPPLGEKRYKTKEELYGNGDEVTQSDGTPLLAPKEWLQKRRSSRKAAAPDAAPHSSSTAVEEQLEQEIEASLEKNGLPRRRSGQAMKS